MLNCRLFLSCSTLRGVLISRTFICAAWAITTVNLLSAQGGAVCQYATADSTAIMRSVFMPRRGKDEHLILQKHAIHGNQL